MMRRRRGPTWTELVRELGVSVIDLLRAESRALQADLGRSGKRAGIGMGLIATAAALAFWSLGVATIAAIAVVAIWLPVWGASLVVLGLLVLVVVILGFFGSRELRSIEPPGVTVARHVDDLRAWWATELTLENGSAVVGEEPDEE